MAKKLVFANNPLLSGPALNQRETGGVPYREVSLSAIDRDTNQPRTNFDEGKLKELSDSIRLYGVLSPILLKPGKSPGRYQLVAGERRFRAASLAGLTSIPAIISSDEDSEERTLAVQLVENIQRAELSPIERAYAIGALRDAHGLSIREVAGKLGVSKSMVQRSLELLELPDDLLNALRQGASESKVLLLSKVESVEKRQELLKDLETLTRDSLKEKVGTGNKVVKVKTHSRVVNPDDQRIADEIQRALGMRVRLSRTNAGTEAGKLTLEFHYDEELQEVFRKLVSE